MATRRNSNPPRPAAHAAGAPATPVRTEGVAGPPLPPSKSVTALRVVGRDLVLQLPVDKVSFTLGSAPPSEVDLSLRVDGGEHVSRLHAVIQRVDNWLKITDQSTNGIFHQGRREKVIHVASGGRFDIDTVPLLALDDHLAMVRPILHRFLGYTDTLAVDHATETIASPDPLLIAGPRGSEHDRLAKEIHDATGRRSRPFVAVALTSSVAEQKAAIARARRGTVFVDAASGKLTRQLVDYLFNPDYGVRPVFGTTEPDRLRTDLGPALAARLREVYIPAVSTRPKDVPHLFNALFIEAGSTRRLEELPRDRLDAVCTFDWPENLADIRRNASRVLAHLSHKSNAEAARALGVRPPSLHQALARIRVIAPDS